MNKLFKVRLYEEISGYAVIMAKNEEEARAKAQAILEDEGIEGFDNSKYCFDITDREAKILDIEKED
jgi:hypothetical protein